MQQCAAGVRQRPSADPAAAARRAARALLALRVASGWVEGPHRRTGAARYQLWGPKTAADEGDAAAVDAAAALWLAPAGGGGGGASLAPLLPAVRQLVGGGGAGAGAWPWEPQLAVEWLLAEAQGSVGGGLGERIAAAGAAAAAAVRTAEALAPGADLAAPPPEWASGGSRLADVTLLDESMLQPSGAAAG